MKPPRPNGYRDAWCGELDAARVGETVRDEVDRLASLDIEHLVAEAGAGCGRQDAGFLERLPDRCHPERQPTGSDAEHGEKFSHRIEALDRVVID